VKALALHPSASVDAKAVLGPGVQVGPGSVIGPEVELGEDVEIGAHVVLEGRVTIGARSRIGHGSTIGGAPQDLKFRAGIPAGVRIGPDTVIREQVVIHHATQPGEDTVVGAHCLVMAQVHVAHDCLIGDHVVLVTMAGLTGHVVVEDRATVGGLTGIHPFTRIGRYAYVGGCVKVTQDVPPCVVADGTPARAVGVNVIGMRRAGVPGETRAAVRRAFRHLYRAGLRPAAAARELAEREQDPLVLHLARFVLASRRGVIRGGEVTAEEESPA
jgi:UDP-N-acetylglucosamine acyltransferase